ncbi:MAG TPA: 30S ribosomal protein S12 methylthiotransferase RimO [Microthrixaceae bacterium]|nr:30S ribosomal protein S12 methylthiotransferase RimO [Microthrixaceae bacterium]MCO5305835.1 30S ribosomal protein S12 methylthiotransferase RimO [Microthrixaceae bacterium]HMV73787.1 30S ribosomal protein S12 methylthiotransferase RimO [Microthrixaceae bacterium]HMX07378.1 30S ribosomal protein S12 methylthiotransferase RimO [Microthrixaceae bacterium]HMY86235.1 30S ribosomal protein S12 methylthiotransferase RimO [Microthrixaceae bacterium]
MSRTYWVETLGCPKNQVDSDKLIGTLHADGLLAAASADEADLVVVNTCAFVAEAREESVATILALEERRAEGAELVVTGCMAERYGDELAAALPEVDAVAGFGVPVTLGPTRGSGPAVPTMDLLNLPRPRSERPWAYVKVAEGCDKACGFCAIPSFRGPQRSRPIEAVLDEVAALQVREVVLVAQDLAAYGRDRDTDGRIDVASGTTPIAELVRAVAAEVDRVRLLYLYPSEMTDELVELIATGPVPYFDLSLQHVSAPLVRRMRRWGDGERFLARIDAIRTLRPDAAFRSNFIVGYPGETEDDHDQLLDFVESARLDWCGFFAYSAEDGTYAAGLDGAVEPALVGDRLAELRELQDTITGRARDALVGERTVVLVDEVGVARSHREAPEIDGIIEVPDTLAVGELHLVEITAAAGPDLTAEPV